MELKIDLDLNNSRYYYFISVRAIITKCADLTVLWNPDVLKKFTPNRVTVVEDGIASVRFNNLREYLECLDKVVDSVDWFLVMDCELQKTIEWIKGEVGWPTTSNTIVGVTVDNNIYGFRNGKYFYGFKIYTADGFYTTHVEYSDNKLTREEEESLRQSIVSNGGIEYNYARHLSNTLVKLRCKRLMYRVDSDTVINYCQRVSSFLSDKGCKFSAVQITYIDGSHKLGYVASARDLICLIDKHKFNTLFVIEVIGVCECELRAGEKYIVDVEGRGTFQYVHSDMKEFSKIFNRYFKKGIKFVISR